MRTLRSAIVALAICGWAAHAAAQSPAPEPSPPAAEEPPNPDDGEATEPDGDSTPQPGETSGPSPEGSDGSEEGVDAAAAGDPEEGEDLGESNADEPNSEADEEEPLPPEHIPEIQVEVDNADQVRTGGLFHLRIVATVPVGDDISIPQQEFGDLVVHHTAVNETEQGNRRRFEFRFDLLALSPGDHDIEPITLRVLTADHQVGRVQTEAMTLRVRSHLTNEPDPEPRPATEPVPVFEEDYTLAWALGIIGIVLLTALLTFLFARWWMRREPKEPPQVPTRPPWEVALENLDAIQLEKKTFAEEGRLSELVDRVSDIVREYLGARYDFNGLESTTDEILAALAKVRFRRISLRDIEALLADSDLVKFAKAEPSSTQCEELIAGSYRIVQATMPVAGPRGTTPPGTTPPGTTAVEGTPPRATSPQDPPPAGAVPPTSPSAGGASGGPPPPAPPSPPETADGDNTPLDPALTEPTATRGDEGGNER